MANVKCDLNSLILLENDHLPIKQQVVDNPQFTCTNVNTAQCTNLICSNECTELIGNTMDGIDVCQSPICLLDDHQMINQPQISKEEEPASSSNLELDEQLFRRSIYFEVIKSNRFKNRKADLKFPRKFFCTQKSTKICYLQPSLFENIPPTIYFGLDDESIQKPSSKDASLMIWRLSSITPTLIRETVLRSGFKLIRENSTNTKWIATWCKHLNTYQYAGLTSNQKVNHFPGSFNFGRKDRLWQNISSLCARIHEESEEDAFHPRTYILPNDAELLKYVWSANPDLKMILKPPAGARGQGIQVIHKFKQIPKEARAKQQKGSRSSTIYIVQNYIENPLLLFNQAKFDIRLYVLITSFDPLRLYLYDDGLIRFASEQYSTRIEDLNNQFMHLTNYSINKNSDTYKQNNDESSTSGHKWTLKTFLNYISKNRKDVCIKKLTGEIIDLIVKSVISCHYPVYKYLLKNQKYKYNNFELLGFDIMLDSDFKPWILEVNVSPSLRSESSVDTSVKSQLIKDTFNIVGYRLPLKYSEDLLNYKLTDIEKEKHANFAEKFTKLHNRTNGNFHYLGNYDFGLTENLLPDDIRHLCLAEDELSRSGSFLRLFPSKKCDAYLSCFTKSFYRTFLLLEWERKYSDRREEAVAFLQKLCAQKLNLMGRRGRRKDRINPNSSTDESD